MVSPCFDTHARALVQNSEIDTFQRMWRFMSNTRPSVFVNSTQAGIARVIGGKYAFLMESAMARYFANRDCRLVQVGGLLDQVGYGIGTQPGDTTGLAG